MQFQVFISSRDVFNSKVIKIAVLMAAAILSQAQAAEIVLVTPTGSVKQVQQVRVQFSANMVPFGDPRSKVDPLSLKCNVKSKKKDLDEASEPLMVEKTVVHKSRWIDSKNWSIDFDRPLASGIHCALKIVPTAKDLAGQLVTGLSSYEFSTSGPALLGASPRYRNVEPEQYFVLQLDGEINPKSVESKVYFESEKFPDKIAVRIVTGSDRDVVARAAIHDNWNWHDLEKYAELKKPLDTVAPLKNFLVIAGKRRFPEDAKLVLHWPRGILSATGLPVEEAQSFQFHVMPPFEAKFNCERTNPDRPCNPILPLKINFTNRVKLSILKGSKLIGAGGENWTPTELSAGDQNQNGVGVVGNPGHQRGFQVTSNFADQEVDTLTFPAPLPEKMDFKIQLPKGIHDEIGRSLENQNKFPLSVATDSFSPLIKFAASFGLLELKAEPVLPVSVRSVEDKLVGQELSFAGKDFVLDAHSRAQDVVAMLKRLEEKEYSYNKRGEPLLQSGQGSVLSVPRPGKSGDFELVGIPLKTPGFHVVELKSAALGQALLGGGPMYVASGALVTDLSVHLKKGRESSIIWVTHLSDARPVENAEVAIYTASGEELVKGKTNSSGIWSGGAINYPCAVGGMENTSSCEVYAFAKLKNDFSFVSSAWSKGIEEYRFNLRREYNSAEWGPIVAHTVMDRAILKAGETIHFKHVLREHTTQGFSALPDKFMPKHVIVVHSGSRKSYALPFVLDKMTGTATNNFVVPKDAGLGLYEIYLSKKNDAPVKDESSGEEGESFDWQAKSTGQFVVSEYRLPLMEANVKIQGESLISVNKVKLDLSAHYLSGGPAADLKVKVRASMEPEHFEPDIPGKEDFTFFSEPVKVGMFNEQASAEKDASFLYSQDSQLDKEGGLAATVGGIPQSRNLKSLVVEMEYRDPNGEIKTSRSSKTIFPSETIIGLKTDNWMSAPGKVSASGVITNAAGQPLAHRSYSVDAFLRESITHRKRLVGGFYAYDSKTKTSGLGQVCKGTSDDQGRFQCDAGKLPSGSLILQATTEDRERHSTFASVSVSVYSDAGEQWWAPSDSDRIDIIPERTKCEPNQTARFAVRSPFPKSTLLITVEREGVMEAFTKDITRERSTIDVPIKGNFAPNVFVSIIALRGRNGDPQPTALIDLAKPAMKMGIAEIRVGWKAHELKVKVESDHKKYKTREKVPMTIKVETANGKQLPAGAEVALIAVDEGLGRLRHNWSTDLLTSMMGQRELAVGTASSQNQVIGKRHFGSKAKAPGGGGGHGDSNGSRELFDPVLTWEPHLKLDKNGVAHFSVPLNDSITGFQIEAVAQAGMDYFGSGSKRVEASKDLIIYSGFAPVVHDGDQIDNAVTIRNTTASEMKIELLVKCPELIHLVQIAPFKLKAGEAKTITMKTDVPSSIKELNYEITAKDTISGQGDALKTKVRVDATVPDRVVQATLVQLDKTEIIPIQQPKGNLPGRGEVTVVGEATLVRGLAGIKAYMEDYPYTCLEQRVSKAVTLERREDIKALIAELPSYMDGSGLLKFFPNSTCGSAQLSRYILEILEANDFIVPATTQTRVIDGLKKTLNGNLQCASWFDSIVRDNYANEERVLIIEALSRFHAFDATSISSLQLAPNLWRTTTLVAWIRLLDREASLPERDAKLKQAEMILRSRVTVQGTSLSLQGEPDWEASWHLFTSRDQEAMDTFGIAIDHASWATDAGRMARGVVARQKKGTWDTTFANAWGLTNMRKFSAKFEKEKVSGTTSISTASEKTSIDWVQSPTGATKHLAWPKGSNATPAQLRISHVGSGKPWITVQSRAAIPLKAPWDLGYTIKRKISAVSQKNAGSWTSGDVVNVEVTVRAKYDQPWVVLRDPIPAGTAILGAGLEDTSKILDNAPTKKAAVNEVQPWPTEYEEKSLSHFTSYAAYLPKGTYRFNYRIRLNSSGQLHLPPTRAEAMYSPETFGEAPNANWIVAP